MRAAVTTPAREYSAVLAGLGAVLQRGLSAKSALPQNSLSLSVYQESLERLAKGDCVRYRRGEYAYRCRVEAVIDTDHGKEVTMLVESPQKRRNQIAQNSRVKLWGKNLAKLELTLPDGTPLTNFQSYETILKILGAAEAYNFFARSVTDIALCGSKNQILSEAEALCLKHPNISMSVYAKDLLRPCCLFPKTCRSEIYSQRNDDTALSRNGAEAVKLVVFDGATAFLNARSRWPNAHWIVILDRTDQPMRNEAALTILRSILERSHPCVLDGSLPPAGVETVAGFRVSGSVK